MRPPRVAFFTDSFHEVNGVAHTSRNFVSYAERHDLPFLSIRAGNGLPQTDGGLLEVLELPRSRAAISLEKDLFFDPLFFRHTRRIDRALRRFRPDILHITGPSELGIFGAWFAWRHRIPLAASWHTNLHEYAGRRLHWLTRHLSPARAARLERSIERLSLDATTRFYRLARVLFAPNPGLCNLLAHKCHRPVHLMQRGVDTALFCPTRRTRPTPTAPSPPEPSPTPSASLNTEPSPTPTASSQPERSESPTASFQPERSDFRTASSPPEPSPTPTASSQTERSPTLIASSRPERSAVKGSASPATESTAAPATALSNPTVAALRALTPDTLLLGFVGRLSIEKNVGLLPRIQSTLRTLGIGNTRFLIVGHGSLEPELRAALPDALFPGVLRGEALAEAYANMDLLVFPSHTDTFGNVVLEALASGVPALVTPSGGPRHIVCDPTATSPSPGATGHSSAPPRAAESDRTGYILTDDEFAPTLARLAADPGLLTPMRAAARAHALTCSWDAVFDKLYAAYQPLLSPESGAPSS